MRTLLLGVTVCCVVVLSGCNGVFPWFGGQEGELNNAKEENSTSTKWQVKNPGGTTALASAQADKIRMEGMAKLKAAEADVEKVRAEAKAAIIARREAEFNAGKWKDRAVWFAIALVVVCFIFPSVALWLWRKVKNLKDHLWAARGHMTPDQVKEIDAIQNRKAA